ncbi:hypothetical protein, partial [Candidatus Hodarchaeum mangrovi]
SLFSLVLGIKFRLFLNFQFDLLTSLIDFAWRITPILIIFYFLLTGSQNMIKRKFNSHSRTLNYTKKNQYASKNIILGYLVFLHILIVLGIIITTGSGLFIGFITFWLIAMEIILGFVAASEISILTSMSTLQAKGLPVTESTLIQQRLKDEELAIRYPWIINLLLNTIIFLIFSF